jgi:uncharacterized protein (TIGR03435 family)
VSRRKDRPNRTILAVKKSKRSILREAQTMIAKICIVGLMSCGMAVGQTAGGRVAGGATAATGTAATVNAKPLAFEVVSIRRNKTGIGGGNGVTADGYNMKNMFPVLLIGFAYNILEFQRIQGLPDWCRYGSEGYDIDAKVADSDVAAWKKQSPKDFQGALQALLEDRFKLKAHFETRDAPAYALVVAKNGPKFKEARPGDTYPNGEHDEEGKPIIGMRMKDVADGHEQLVAQSVPISTLAQYLSGFLNTALGRQVVDKTKGLS